LRRFEGHTAPVQTLEFLANGSRLVSSGNDARVLVWSIDNETSAPTAGRGTED
jgi:WD40 repeat protein